MPVAPLEPQLSELHPASYGWALGCCNGNGAEAQDVLQATYLKVLEGRARFEGASSFKTWLFAVIRRTAAERRRRRWLRALAFERWSERRPPLAAAPDPEQSASSCETAERLRTALAALPGRQREMVHLVFYQDLTLEEAAQVSGISVGSARTHYHRAKVRLRELLERP